MREPSVLGGVGRVGLISFILYISARFWSLFLVGLRSFGCRFYAWVPTIFSRSFLSGFLDRHYCCGLSSRFWVYRM